MTFRLFVFPLMKKERKRKTELKTERIKENRKKYKKGRKILTNKEKI